MPDPRPRLGAAAALLCLLWTAPAAAMTFTSADRVMVIAPHPDDEALGAGGVLQAATAAGAQTLVVFLTHGDHNELSSIVSLRRPLFSSEDFVRSGRARREEALRAAGELGLPESALIFFGYPDRGLLGMWRRHWSPKKPFRSYRTRINRVPYRSDFSYGNPYTAASLTQDLTKVLAVFRPTHVFVSAPFDYHPDHRAAYLYLTAALWELEGLSHATTVHAYLVHAPHWPYPAGQDPAKLDMLPPPIRWAEGREWTRFELTSEQVAAKKRAIEAHESQTAVRRAFLTSFARKNELFVRVPGETLRTNQEAAAAESAEDLSFVISGETIVARILLAKASDARGGLRLELFGWRADREFAKMPKLEVEWAARRLAVRDQGRSLYGAGVRVEARGRLLRVVVPLKLLGEPHRIFCAASAGSDKRVWDFGAWRVLLLPEPRAGEAGERSLSNL